MTVVVRADPSFVVVGDSADQRLIRDPAPGTQQGAADDGSQLVDDHDVAGITEAHGVNQGVQEILDIVVPVQPTHEGAAIRILDAGRDTKQETLLLALQAQARDSHGRDSADTGGRGRAVCQQPTGGSGHLRSAQDPVGLIFAVEGRPVHLDRLSR
jgi:hypothetical protein